MRPERHTFAALPLARQGLARKRSAGFVDGSDPAARPSVGELVTDASESHVLVIAPTGAGKGRSVLIPWMLSYRGSVIVIDPKGEAASVTARCRREFGQQVCVIDPWQILRPTASTVGGGAQAINPLQVMLQDSADLGDDCLTLAELIVGEAPVSLQDPFWRSLALDLLTALIGWVWVRAEVTGEVGADDGTLAGVWAQLHIDDVTYGIAALMDTHGKKPGFPRFVQDGFVTFLNHESERVRPSILSEAVSMLRIFGSARIQAATACTTVPLQALRDGRGVDVMLVVPPDRLESHAPYVRLVLGTLLALMAQRRSRPSLPTLFLVDELGHLGPIPQLKQATTLLRGYGVRVALFIQALSQLKSLWPRDHETMLENCGTWLNFGNTSLGAARQVAEQLGDINAEALFQMGGDELVVHRAGRPTEIARKLDYLTDPLYQGRFDPNPYHAQGPLGRLR